MNKEDIIPFEAHLTSRIEKFLSGGGQLIRGLFGRVSEKRCCPLSTVVNSVDDFIDGNSRGAIEESIFQDLHIEIDSEEKMSFAYGYDDSTRLPALPDLPKPYFKDQPSRQAMYELGWKIGSKYPPTSREDE